MSKNHLLALEEALASKGWRVVAVLPGDDYRISATWQVERGGGQSRLFIDFDGLEPGGITACRWKRVMAARSAGWSP